MYLRVISRDTMDSLMGSNLKLFRSYGGGDEAADMETDALRGEDFALRWKESGVMGTPWKEDSKREVFL